MMLPAGMRNNNPGNIKYVGQAGTHPSVNTDQGDPQAVYPSADAGMAAMYQLLLKKYKGGKVTPNMIIAGQGGWTPGNRQAAANVARTAGIGPDDDIGMADPARAARFMRGLLLQEHGTASNAYTDAMISSAIGGGGQYSTATSDRIRGPVEAAGGGSGNEAGESVTGAMPTIARARLAEGISQPTQVAGGFTLPPIGGQYTLQKEKTTGEKLGDAVKGFGNQKAASMGEAPQIGMAQFSQGQPIPSVMRSQFQPVSAPLPQMGMGGGQDLRQLLAQLMAQGGGGYG